MSADSKVLVRFLEFLVSFNSKSTSLIFFSIVHCISVHVPSVTHSSIYQITRSHEFSKQGIFPPWPAYYEKANLFLFLSF